jgi:hypothetical protein
MEETPPSVEQNNSNSTVHSKRRLIISFSVIVVFLLLLGILNYFNIVSVSGAFPDQLGWLPRQAKVVNLTPKPVGLCAHFLNNSGKVSCQQAVNTALADTPGKVVRIVIGPLQLNPAIIKTMEHQKLTIPATQVWIINIELAKPLVASDGKIIKSELIEVPVDGTKGIYRKQINL